MSSNTTRAGAIALAASLATALTAAGGAGAIDVPKLPPLKVVEAAQQDVSNVTSSIQPVVDNVAPNTRAAVSATVKQTVASVGDTVKSTLNDTQQTVSHTVKATDLVAASAVTNAVQTAGDAVTGAGRTVNATTQMTGRVSRSTSRKVGEVKGDVSHALSNTDAYLRSTRRSIFAAVQRITAQLDRFLRNGSIGAARSVMGGWQLSWTRSGNGCMSIRNEAPDLLVLQPFRIGVVDSNNHSAYLGQRDTSSSLDISC